MVLVNELKGKMKAKGYTQEKLAKELGMSTKTLNTKLNKGIFGSYEIERLIEILEIKNPIEIFFCQVSYL